MIKLNKRLACVASFIKDNVSVIDVGCDHAFLSIYLKKQRENIKVLASDKNIGPLNIAKNNIKSYGLENEINTLCMDGIDNISNYIDTVIISGMGSITMTKILKKEKLNNIKNIILSPNNDFYLIRKYLTDLGYEIIKEEMVLEKGKFYPVILFEKGNEIYNDLELEYGPILIKEKKEDFIKYLNYKLDEINKILENIDKNNDNYKNFINQKQDIIKILEN